MALETLLTGLIVLLTILFGISIYHARRVRQEFRTLELEMASGGPPPSIDEKKLAQQILLSKKQLETSFDALADPICAIDDGHSILRVNRSYAQCVNLPIRDTLKRQCHMLFFGKSQTCDNCPAKKTLQSGRPEHTKSLVRQTNGEIRYFDISTYPVFGQDNSVINVIEHIRDVTEEKQMLEQLIRSEKLASIGIMSAGIAHEMNNSLSGISGNATNLVNMPEKYGINEKGLARITTILECATRTTQIIKDLLRLSRKEEGVQTQVDINRLVERSVQSFHLEGFDLVEKKMDLCDSMPLVYCDPLKIEQVIINIISNAVQSIREKGERETAQGKAFKGMLRFATFNHKNHVRITILDNGMGIPGPIQKKIFDPFFTTRPAGQGTGLGLSISHKIIEEHHGRIFFESRDGESVFTLILPVDASEYNE